MRIDVTQRDIDMGVQRNECRCPVARAVRRATRRKLVSVNRVRVQIWGRHEKLEFRQQLPDDVQRFVRQFDASGKTAVGPFSFELDIPQEVR